MNYGQVGNDFSLDGNSGTSFIRYIGKSKIKIKHVIRKTSGHFGGLQTVKKTDIRVFAVNNFSNKLVLIV